LDARCRFVGSRKIANGIVIATAAERRAQGSSCRTHATFNWQQWEQER
jgi:hypothetical protein